MLDVTSCIGAMLINQQLRRAGTAPLGRDPWRSLFGPFSPEPGNYANLVPSLFSTQLAILIFSMACGTAGRVQFEIAIAMRNVLQTFDSGKLDTLHNSRAARPRMKFRMPGAAGSGLTDGGLPPRVAGRKPMPVDREAEISGGHAPVAAMQTMLVPPPAQQPAAKPPDASSEAIVACKATGRPYTGDQPPPGYPDARRGTGVHGNEWSVPLQKGKWAVLCVAN